MTLSLPCAVALLCFCMMSVKAAVRLILLLLARSAFSVPLDSSENSVQLTNIIIITDVVTSETDVLETATLIVPVDQASISNSRPTLSPLSTVQTYSAITSFASLTTSTSSHAVATETIIVTATVTASPITVIISEPVETVTEIVTSPPPSDSQYTLTTWSAPQQITDLGVFNISSFAYGQTNLRIVDGIPATASMAKVAAVESTGIPNVYNTPSWDNSSSALELRYPANSINPGTEPQGGADFYATPLDLHGADSIAFEYSVFFPVDFNWVLAGKLPGIFGGHKGCSGGNDAQTCFSTRLMWRQGGAGELYLYAPKDKQTSSLCSTPPMSVCNDDFGLSIGRGSFHFIPGAWTHVKQTITLNTPGKQDGGFRLEVNGRQAMQLLDVFYREYSQISSPKKGTSTTVDGVSTTPVSRPNPSVSSTPLTSLTPPTPSQPSQASDSGGLLDGLLGPLLGGLGGLLYRVTANTPATQFFMLRDDVNSVYFAPSRNDDDGSIIIFSNESIPATISTQAVSTVDDKSYSATYYPESYGFTHASEPAGFIGLFFSTFFGGHDTNYATPRDQYAWFKDFAIAINADSSALPSSNIPKSSQTAPSSTINALTAVDNPQVGDESVMAIES